MDSLWKLTAARPSFPELSDDLKTDVLIIGGGISGILCAHMLKRAGVDCTLVEADRICSGTSGRTTAKITLQHGLIYDRLIQKYGVNFTKTSNDRECGWLAVKELLLGGDGRQSIRFFSVCTEIIKCLPALTVDKLRPTDCSNEPHEITHAPDALRGFAIFYARPAEEPRVIKCRWSADMWEDYINADDSGKKYLKNKYGEPN